MATHFFAGPEDVYPYYHEYLRPKTRGGRGFLVDRPAFEAGAARGQAIMVGSSEQVTEKILDACQMLGLDRFLGQFDWGGLPRALVEESLHRYATEIAPEVRRAA